MEIGIAFKQKCLARISPKAADLENNGDHRTGFKLKTNAKKQGGLTQVSL